MTDRYDEWRDFYAKRVSSWMSLEELRAECGKLTTTDSPSPEVLLIHAMHALEVCEQRDTALLRQALEALEVSTRFVYADLRPQCESTIDALRERLAETADDLARCPTCGGPADNGHDREVPPTPYWCSKCTES